MNDDDEPDLTTAEKREFREILRERELWKRVRIILATSAKTVVAVAASIAVVQTGWAVLVKWLVK